MIWEFVYEKQLGEKGFHVDVEETQSLGGNFVCMVNHEGKKLYFRKGETVKEGTILHPLSKEELKSLNVEETANSEIEKLFNIEVEE
jgi:hypothetical protein